MEKRSWGKISRLRGKQIREDFKGESVEKRGGSDPSVESLGGNTSELLGKEDPDADKRKCKDVGEGNVLKTEESFR